MNNLKSYTEYAVTSSTTDFVIGFEFNYGTDAVNITVDGVPASEAGYTVVYLNSTTMRLNPAVSRGVVRLQRETDIDAPDNSFTAGAKFIASNMDENFSQIRHAQQEVRDGFNKLSTDTNEIIGTLEDVAQSAQDAANAAEAAAQTANDAAAQVNDKVSYQDLDNAVDVALTPVTDYIALPFKAGKTYQLNGRVALGSGDVVKSIVSANMTNPNVDMTGWVKVNDASQIFTQTALNQEMFNQKIERQTANHSVNLVDFLTRKQWKDWQENNESVDFTDALETAFSTMYNSAPFLNGIRWGVGEIVLPRGVVRLDLRQIQLNKAYGLILRGQGAAATQIKVNRAASANPTELNDSLFRSGGYTYLELANFSVTCTSQDINFIRLNGIGGGRELLMRNVTTQGFKHIMHIEGNINTDTNYADRCTFGACKSVVYTRSGQAVVNTYLHCTFGVGIAKAFDVAGFGYTTFISCNVVTGGKFYHVASDGASYFGQVVTFINTKLEHNTDGKSQLLTSDNNPNAHIFAKFIGSGMVSADTPDANTYQIDVAGKLKIEIDGGEWNKCKFRFGQSIDYNTTVDIKNCSNPPSPANISFLEYQPGYGYNYPSVNFKNNLNMLDLIVRHEKSTTSNLSTTNCISLRGAALLQAGSATPNTRTFDMKGQRCLVNSLDLYVKSWTSITNLRVSVFADAAFTIPMNTEQVIALPTASGSTPLKVNIPLTVQSFTDKLYVRITNDQLYGIVIGHFKLDSEFI